MDLLVKICLLGILFTPCTGRLLKAIDSSCDIIIANTYTKVEPGEHENSIVFLTPKVSQSTLEQAIRLCNNIFINLMDDWNLEIFLRNNFKILPVQNTYTWIGPNLERFNSYLVKKFIYSEFLTQTPDGNQRSWIRKHPLSSRFEQNYENIYSKSRQINFNGASMRASAFHFPPFSLFYPNGTVKPGGFEYDIVAEVAKAINVDLKVSLPADGEWWGSETDDGSHNYTGVQGDLQHGRADIAWGNLMLNRERLNFMSFSMWHTFDSFCVLVPKFDYYPKIVSLILPFDKHVWIGSLIGILALFVILGIYSKIHEEDRSFHCNWGLYFIGVILVQSSVISTKIKHNAVRFLVMVIILSMFVLATAYGSSLKSIMTVNKAPAPMNTLETLAENVSKRRLNLYHCCGSVIDNLDSSVLEHQRKLAQLTKELPDKENAIYIKKVADGFTAVIDVQNKLKFYIRSFLTSESGETNVHLMEECFALFPIAFGLQKNSIFKKPFNDAFIRIVEAGIADKIIEDARETLGKLASNQFTFTKQESLSLSDMQGIFIVLVILSTVSAFLLALEIILFKVKRRLSLGIDVVNIHY